LTQPKHSLSSANYATHLEKRLDEEKAARERLERELSEVKKLLELVSANYNLKIPL